MNLRKGGSRRRAIAGLIVALLIFAMLFTAGIGYLLVQTRSDFSSYQANAQALQQRAQISQEQLAFGVSLNGSNYLKVTVNDTGGFPISVVSIFVKDSTGKLISPPGVLTLGVPGTTAKGPLNLDVGGTGPPFTINYRYTSGTVYVAIVTSRGNVFTQQYPPSASITVSGTSSVTTITSNVPGGAVGNSLVIVMAATPIQVFDGNIVTDNVTLYNYSPLLMTGASLHPTVPWSNVTGYTASLTKIGCTGPYTPPGQISDPTETIPGYNGVGVAPHIYFLCTYTARTGTVGGLASFSGWAFATQGTTTVESASVVSNLVQIGGLTSVLNQGPFSTNFFFFKYSSCTNSPNYDSTTGEYNYSAPCTTDIAPASWPPSSPSKLPEGAVVSASSNYYLAFYVQITNNFNTPLPLLQYTFLQLDPSNAYGESDWWLAGTSTTNYPNYNPGSSLHIPTLTAYPIDCANVNAQNIPYDNSCIYLNPGQTVTITLAACGYSAYNWDWGGAQYGWFDDYTGCVSSQPGVGYSGSAMAASTVIAFEYGGQIFTEDIAFNGVAFVH